VNLYCSGRVVDCECNVKYRTIPHLYDFYTDLYPDFREPDPRILLIFQRMLTNADFYYTTLFAEDLKKRAEQNVCCDKTVKFSHIGTERAFFTVL
jgi:hypothetical protein